jgi:D-3-phosphoglycerate dehydrogenase
MGESDLIARNSRKLARDGALDVQVQIGAPRGVDRDHSGIQRLFVRSETKVTSVFGSGSKVRRCRRVSWHDNVDVETATRRGRDRDERARRQHGFHSGACILMLLCAARKLPQADAMVRSGKWSRKDLQGVELYNKTLGIIGMGASAAN